MVSYRGVIRRGSIQLLLLAGGLLLASPATATASNWPVLDTSAVEASKLFDLGVTDYDVDGNLDIFSINHKYDTSLLRGDGAGGLVESTVAAGLSPTPQFPGYESLRREPALSLPGVYLYGTDFDETPRATFHIRTTSVPSAGRLVFGSRDLQVLRSRNAVLRPGRLADGSATLNYRAQRNADIAVTVEHLDLPISVAIGTPAPGRIRVGADAAPATTRSFELDLRDRHGYAFGDFDGDRRRDLFIASGGLGGGIADPYFTSRARDELLLSRRGRYLNATAGSGLRKGPCRGRGVDTADVDGDGRMDILVACEGSTPRLYLGNGDGTFRDGPSPPAPGETYRLADLRGDSSPELIATEGPQVSVWRYARGGWLRVQRLAALNAAGPIRHLALGDYDNDGDLDAFAASPRGNTLLRNAGGRLRSVRPQRLMLPRKSTTASFVDYDNDGDLDLHAMPQGIFESDGKRYRRTARLDFEPAAFGVLAWFDLDNDGRRDMLSARGAGAFAVFKEVEMRANRTRDGRWLQADLLGPRGNSSAIGAMAKIKIDGRWSHQWVGQNDDSAYSSGHYRLYWGLGKARMVNRLVVVWPDGSRYRKRNVEANQLLEIRYRRNR